ncbi:hypothetical protein [Arthrobacter sp. UYCu723]
MSLHAELRELIAAADQIVTVAHLRGILARHPEPAVPDPAVRWGVRFKQTGNMWRQFIPEYQARDMCDNLNKISHDSVEVVTTTHTPGVRPAPWVPA